MTRCKLPTGFNNPQIDEWVGLDFISRRVGLETHTTAGREAIVTRSFPSVDLGEGHLYLRGGGDIEA